MATGMDSLLQYMLLHVTEVSIVVAFNHPLLIAV